MKKSRRWKRMSQNDASSSPSGLPLGDGDFGSGAAELGGEEKRILRSLTGPEDELPYLRRPLQMANGVIVEEYIIPDSDRQKVLEKLFIFAPMPSLDDVMYDLHEKTTFRVRDYRVTREGDNNFLVSPYYPRSGGTVLDWVDVPEDDDIDPDGMFTQIRKVKE